MKKILLMGMAALMSVAAVAAQCAATTKKGSQCKRQASPGSQYCWQHGGTTKAERDAGQTAPSPDRRVSNRGQGEQSAGATVAGGRGQATTKAGTQCKRKADPGSQYCWQHGGAKNAQGATRQVDVQSETHSEPPTAGSDGQCTATTKDGTRCKRKAKQGSNRCWQHDK